jgi:hypothetical protein
MQKYVLFVLVLILFGLTTQPLIGQDAATDESDGEEANTQEYGLYELITLPISIEPSLYSNPFDPNDIELLGIFQSPSQRQFVIPGFWMQPYENQCETGCEIEDLQPNGQPTWQVRFTPQETGSWSYILQVRDNGTVVDSQEGAFDVVASDLRGFIRVGTNKRYFQYQNGDSFFPIGHNLNWSWDEIGGLETYLDWLESLSEVGGNYARLFIDVPWFIGLEWESPAGDYRAAQDHAAKLDIILEAAAEYGIELQLVLLWHQSLRTYSGAPVVIPEEPPRADVSADWSVHSYSVLNGGPMSGPAVFLLNTQAQELFRRRLRYIVARWGHSPQIFAWEIIDRIDRIGGYDPAAADTWLRDTASYLRQIDQHGHLITAGSFQYDPVVAENPLLDFSESQFYQRRPVEDATDQVISALNVVRQNLQTNPTPTMMVSYSLNPWFEPLADDPQGVHFQDTLWAVALSGAAGGAVSDWWDTYVIPQDLQSYYRVLSAFTEDIDWANSNFQAAEAGLIGDNPAAYEPVRVSNFNRQFTTQLADIAVHDITPDGVFPNIENVSAYLYGRLYNTQFRQVQQYRVSLPLDSYLEIGTRSVSSQADATLAIIVDGQTMVELDVNAENANVQTRVPLAAGEHTVILENIGDDWLELEYLEIGNLVAPGRAVTLRDSTAGIALAWLQHRDYTWDKVAAGVIPEPISFRYRLDKMPSGLYLVEIWHPLSGAMLGEEFVTVNDDGVLSFDLVPIESQLALRMFLQSPPPDSMLDNQEISTPEATPSEPILAPVETNTPRPGDT